MKTVKNLNNFFIVEESKEEQKVSMCPSRDSYISGSIDFDLIKEKSFIEEPKFSNTPSLQRLIRNLPGQRETEQSRPYGSSHNYQSEEIGTSQNASSNHALNQNIVMSSEATQIVDGSVSIEAKTAQLSALTSEVCFSCSKEIRLVDNGLRSDKGCL